VRNWISWLLKESEGVSVLDKLLLFFVKFIYLSLRIILRVALGKKRRDRLALERGLCFGDFCNKFFKHGFEFYCRNNKDEFKIMTMVSVI